MVIYSTIVLHKTLTKVQELSVLGRYWKL